MRSPLTLGGCVVAGMAVVGTTLLLAPGSGRAESSAPADQLDAARAAAETFWGRAVDGECRSAADLMWWPADRAARQRAYTGVCRQADIPDDAVVGEPRYASPTHPPYGASDVALVPVTLVADGQETEDELQMVRVDGDWLVIR